MKITERLMAKKLYGQKKLVVEAVDYPSSSYGYWITNSGEILPVDDGHEVTAELYLNNLGMDSTILDTLKMSATRYAIEGLGWIRIVTEIKRVIYIDFMSETVNRKVVFILIDFLQSYSRDHLIQYYKIDATEGMNFDEGRTDHADFDSLRHTLAFLRSTGINVTEANVPQSNYGYWVTHTGDILPVPRMTTHNDIAEEYIRENSLDHSEYWQQHQPAMMYAIREMGWVRVISYKYLDIHYSTRIISDRTISSLVKVIRALDKDLNFQKVYVNTDSHPSGFGVFVNVKDAVRMIRTNSAPVVSESAIPSTVYGYWIDHTGQFYPTNKSGEHGSKALEISKKYGLFKKFRRDPYKAAFEMGWVRVVLDMWLELEFHKKTVSKVALKSAYNLAIQSKMNSNYLKLVSDEEQLPNSVKLNYTGMIDILEKYLGINPSTVKKYQYTPKSFLQRLSKRKPVKEANIPYTNYGFWIDEDGNVYPVGTSTGHTDSLYQHFPRKYNINSATWDEITINHPYLFELAYEKGWARVISTDTVGLGIALMSRRVPTVTWRTLIQLAKTTNYSKYFIDDNSKRTEIITFDHRHGDPRRKMLQLLGKYQHNSKRRQVKEAREIPKADYGYWISAKGEIIPVEKMGHAKYATQELRRRHGEVIAGNPVWRNPPSMTLYNEGWIRVVTYRDEISMKMSNVTRASKLAAIHLIRNDYYEGFRIDYRYFDDASKNRSSNFPDANKMIAFIKNVPFRMTEATETSCEESFWVSPDAEVLYFGSGGHEQYMSKLFKSRGYTMDKWPYPSAQATAFSLGWIRGCFRIVNASGSVDQRRMTAAIEAYQPTQKNLMKICDMLRKRKDVELYFINNEQFSEKHKAFAYIKYLLGIHNKLTSMGYEKALNHLAGFTDK